MKPTIRTRGVAIALILFFLGGQLAHAGGKYYRWTDDNGTTVNSDRPPSDGTDYQIIDTSANLAVPSKAPAPEQAPDPAPAAAPAAPEEMASAPHQASQKDPANCEAAKQNLETLSTYARIRIPDGDGNFRFLNEEEKAAQRTKAEKAIAQFCE